MNGKQHPASDPRPDEFMSVYLAHQRQLFRYLLSLVMQPQDAEDLLQEVSATLWEKYAEYEPGTNFFAWAKRIAYLKVLNFRRKRSQTEQLLAPDVVDLVNSDASWRQPQEQDYHEALDGCMQKLQPSDRELVQARYAPEFDRQAIAKRLGRPANSVSKSLARIRAVLMECIERRVSPGGRNAANGGDA